MADSLMDSMSDDSQLEKLPSLFKDTDNVKSSMLESIKEISDLRKESESVDLEKMAIAKRLCSLETGMENLSSQICRIMLHLNIVRHGDILLTSEMLDDL